VWVYPHDYETNDPLKPNWYKPSSWFVMGKQIHSSRLLTLISHPVSDLLKPAYSFGGIPLIQMAKPYVDNWLAERQAGADILQMFSIFILKTNLDSVLSGGSGDTDVVQRAELFNKTRSNRGLYVLDKDKEDFGIVASPLASSQASARAASMPPVRARSGFYYDLIHSAQTYLLRPQIQTIMDMCQIELFGDVDADITFDFVELYEMTEVEAAEVRLTDAQTGAVLIGQRPARRC
jgi:hypothetical protein